MILPIIMCAAVCLSMTLAVLLFPKLKLGRLTLDSYWVVTLLGAAVTVAVCRTDLNSIWSRLTANTAVNPLKILVLFISMTVMSVYLDELGFFRYLANAVLKKARSSQLKLFIYLYLTVSVLTVFTSNDVIILSFTPFICYFAESAGICALPYLAAEFVAANTWSMALMIGNPTNIYLSTAFGIGFAGYMKVMLLPTVCAGAVAFAALFIFYRRKLSAPLTGTPQSVTVSDKPCLVLGIAHLSVCTLILAVSSYLHIEMWLVSLVSVVSLYISTLTVSAVRREKPRILLSCARRAPWQLIPFVLSMFVVIIVLDESGATAKICGLLGEKLPWLTYGVSSFAASNVINNIPMSVLFSSVIAEASETVRTQAVFAAVVGSNVGAFLTPVGALAGIMFSSILGTHGIKFGYRDFLKMGVTAAIPALLAALGVLALIT